MSRGKTRRFQLAVPLDGLLLPLEIALVLQAGFQRKSRRALPRVHAIVERHVARSTRSLQADAWLAKGLSAGTRSPRHPDRTSVLARAVRLCS